MGCNFEKEKMYKEINPYGYSGETSCDGTPLTNYGRWEKLNKFS